MKKFIAMLIVILSVQKFSVLAADYGIKAYEHILRFSSIGNRALVTKSEVESRDYIIDTLENLGYKPKCLKFKVKDYETCNIEVNKEGKDKSKTVILGAHYDGRMEGNAFDDNGSGISVLLELCEVLKNQETPYNLKFIFFGAEEINILGKGLHGSYDYVEGLSKKEKDKIKYMINLDTLVSGDKMYVYNSYKDEDVSDLSKNILNKVKEISEDLNIDINFNFNDQLKTSFTKTKSDYYPFYEINIPVLYFESTNWEAGEKDGRTQSDLAGRVIHSKMDNMIFVENVLNDNIQDRLKNYVDLVKEIVIKTTI